jgi:hypothetical protein
MPVISTRMQAGGRGGAARHGTASPRGKARARAITRATKIALDRDVRIEAIPGLFDLHSCGFGMKFNYKYGASRQKLALFLRLHENDMQVTFSFLYRLSDAPLWVSGYLCTVPCAWTAGADGGRPATNTALRAPERFLEWKLHVP